MTDAPPLAGLLERLEAADAIEVIAEALMLRDVAPLPRVWNGPPCEGKEVDNRGVVWTTYTPACSERERQKWRREAARFIALIRAKLSEEKANVS